jgi:hypothetical protein
MIIQSLKLEKGFYYIKLAADFLSFCLYNLLFETDCFESKSILYKSLAC